MLSCRSSNWLSTHTRRRRLIGGIWAQRRFGEADGLPSAAILALYCTADNRVWAGTEVGLALPATPKLPVRALGDATTPHRTLAWAFVEDGPDHLWLGAATGLTRIDKEFGRAVDLPALPQVLENTTIWSLCRDQMGRLWVGARRLGLFCLDPATGAPELHLLEDRKVDVPSMCQVEPHHLWIATERQGLLGVDVRTREVTTTIGTREGMPDLDIRSLAVDRHGRLWAGTVSGRLICVDPRHGVVLHVLEICGERAPAMVLGLMGDARGLLWACSGGAGLVCVDPDGPAVVHRITAADGLRGNSIYSCRADDGGHLWLGTTRGVMRFSPDTGQCVAIEQSLGLPDDDCNSNAIHLDERGRLWVGTARGVGIIDTALVPDDVPPCLVYMTAFSVMGQPRELTPELVLEDSDFDLQFEHGAVSYVAPASVVYRVQLVGLETDWSEATPQRSRRYTNLRPGLYTFQVSADNWGGCWGPPLEVRFRIIRNRQADILEEAQRLERIEADQLKSELVARTQTQAAAAIELAELRSNFVTSVSHELRTPSPPSSDTPSFFRRTGAIWTMRREKTGLVVFSRRHIDNSDWWTSCCS